VSDAFKMAKPILNPIPLNGGKLGEKPALAPAWLPCLLASLQRGGPQCSRGQSADDNALHGMAWHGMA
jgi:hypothetical protein